MMDLFLKSLPNQAIRWSVPLDQDSAERVTCWAVGFVSSNEVAFDGISYRQKCRSVERNGLLVVASWQMTLILTITNVGKG